MQNVVADVGVCGRVIYLYRRNSYRKKQLQKETVIEKLLNSYRKETENRKRRKDYENYSDGK